MTNEDLIHRFLLNSNPYLSTILTGEFDYDPIKVFVKQEPHKMSKIKQERYRLISGVSLVDTLVDRLLLQWLAQNVVEHVGETPSRIMISSIVGNFKLILEIRRKIRDAKCL